MPEKKDTGEGWQVDGKRTAGFFYVGHCFICRKPQYSCMLRPEDVETILTTQDLFVYMKDMVEKEDRDLKIDIDYESGELFINCPGFSYGLSVKTDPFGVWVISELISQDNDGIYTQSGHLHKTEKTMTVLRAVAGWIRDLEESTRAS